MRTLTLALAQINTTVGDIDGNAEKVIHYIREAERAGVDVVAFPEMAITGYPPEDLLLKPQFIEDNLRALDRIVQEVGDLVAVVGFVDRQTDIYNAAAVIHNRTLLDVYHKIFLPNYGVFDERRYFQSGSRIPVYRLHLSNGEEVTLGINICEDIWYPDGPHRQQSLAGAEVIININFSPYHIGKPALRERMLSTRAFDSTVIIAYLNGVGGQDELVFDGGSLLFNEKGEIIYRGRQFEEEFILVQLNVDAVFMRRLHDPRRRQVVLMEKTDTEEVRIELKSKRPSEPVLKPLTLKERKGPEEEVYSALVLGTRDYVQKNGFETVLVGLSGGIDSSFVATVAVDALGPGRVKGVFMPSRYTSKESWEDAHSLAENLNLQLFVIPIDGIFQSYLETLREVFRGLKEDVTEENIQARIRGNILMALSNKFGWLVLTTGNKSEMSVGYATLYGDMAGGFAVIKDVPKTMVYKLAHWRNSRSEPPPIPERVLWKEPSAELRQDQRDTDTLPPYEVLDPILRAYIEEDRSYNEILAVGCEPECTQKVIRMIDRSEYKRRQAPPGIKITERAFGRDRRFPITNRYKSY